MEADRLAHRAGGQAIAAYLCGVKITELHLAGITLWVPHRLSRRSELLAELAVGLTGIAATSRYGFGWLNPPAPIVTWRFARCALEDFQLVHAIVRELAPLGDDDVFFEAWSQALDLIGSSTYWRAIEELAASVLRDPLTGIEATDLINRVCGENNSLIPLG